MSEGKWRESNPNPDIEGTQIGNLAGHIGLLKSFFEAELAKEIEKLSYLERKKRALEIQKKKQRKVDGDG